jgi:hypothetical protein
MAGSGCRRAVSPAVGEACVLRSLGWCAQQVNDWGKSCLFTWSVALTYQAAITFLTTTLRTFERRLEGPTNLLFSSLRRSKKMLILLQHFTSYGKSMLQCAQPTHFVCEVGFAINHHWFIHYTKSRLFHQLNIFGQFFRKLSSASGKAWPITFVSLS